MCHIAFVYVTAVCLFEIKLVENKENGKQNFDQPYLIRTLSTLFP